MRYLLLLILLCGCSIREDTLVVDSIHKGETGYKYLYTIKGNTRGTKVDFIVIRSNKEFRVGDRVELTLSKEN